MLLFFVCLFFVVVFSSVKHKMFVFFIEVCERLQVSYLDQCSFSIINVIL